MVSIRSLVADKGLKGFHELLDPGLTTMVHFIIWQKIC